jgi:hypothetical protein
MWSSNNLEIEDDAYGGIVSYGSRIICSSDVFTGHAIYRADYRVYGSTSKETDDIGN